MRAGIFVNYLASSVLVSLVVSGASGFFTSSDIIVPFAGYLNPSGMQTLIIDDLVGYWVNN